MLSTSLRGRMSKIVQLPIKFDISATYRFTREVVGSDGRPTAAHISFDFSRLNFIDGSGFTVLSNTIGWLISQGTVCAFRNFQNLNSPAIKYLDDCGFFKNYLKKQLSEAAKCRSTTLPCTAVKHAHAHGWLEHTFSPWMGGIMDASHGALASIRTCLKELFHNINDHSTKDTGYIHAQHYPNLRNVKITVSDFGRGIPSTIRGKFGDMSDGQAILHACKEGVTAQSRPNNMGAGLNYMIDRVMANQGRVRIFSMSGIVNCNRAKGDQEIRRATTGNGTYPGTLVEIELDTRLFVGDEEERVEVEW